jgi:hypothetical protein
MPSWHQRQVSEDVRAVVRVKRHTSRRYTYLLITGQQQPLAACHPARVPSHTEAAASLLLGNKTPQYASPQHMQHCLKKLSSARESTCYPCAHSSMASVQPAQPAPHKCHPAHSSMCYSPSQTATTMPQVAPPRTSQSLLHSRGNRSVPQPTEAQAGHMYRHILRP